MRKRDTEDPFIKELHFRTELQNPQVATELDLNECLMTFCTAATCVPINILA